AREAASARRRRRHAGPRARTLPAELDLVPAAAGPRLCAGRATTGYRRHPRHPRRLCAGVRPVLALEPAAAVLARRGLRHLPRRRTRGERGAVKAMHRPFSVCVYCGSRTGATPSHVEAAREVGRLIGERGWRLVYGGGKVGLMGVVADAAMAAGANVIGVIPQALMQREVGHQGISQLQVVQTMHQRKQAMAERSDAFIALPGGIGTLEELYEVWTWRQIGYHDRPVGLLNTEGYY